MSDHYPCMLSYRLAISHETSSATMLERQKLTDDSMLKIQQDLLFHDWSPVNHLNVNTGYAYLVNEITRSMDQHAPKKVIRLKADEQFREPWLTVQLKHYNQKCRKLCNKARVSGSVKDHEYYKQYHNTLNRLKLHKKPTTKNFFLKLVRTQNCYGM